MTTWHAVTVNGSFTFEVKEPIAEARDLLRNTLARIDGKARYSLGDEFEVTVYADEVFTADEAAELFGAYLETASVPAKYALRPLSLSGDR